MTRSLNCHDKAKSQEEGLAEDYERNLSPLTPYARKPEFSAPSSVYAAIEDLKEKLDDAEEWIEQEIDELRANVETLRIPIDN